MPASAATTSGVASAPVFASSSAAMRLRSDRCWILTASSFSSSAVSSLYCPARCEAGMQSNAMELDQLSHGLSSRSRDKGQYCRNELLLLPCRQELVLPRMLCTGDSQMRARWQRTERRIKIRAGGECGKELRVSFYANTKACSSGSGIQQLLAADDTEPRRCKHLHEHAHDIVGAGDGLRAGGAGASCHRPRLVHMLLAPPLLLLPTGARATAD